MMVMERDALSAQPHRNLSAPGLSRSVVDDASYCNLVTASTSLATKLKTLRNML